jgi:hypothetical protein
MRWLLRESRRIDTKVLIILRTNLRVASTRRHWLDKLGCCIVEVRRWRSREGYLGRRRHLRHIGNSSIDNFSLLVNVLDLAPPHFIGVALERSRHTSLAAFTLNIDAASWHLKNIRGLLRTWNVAGSLL